MKGLLKFNEMLGKVEFFLLSFSVMVVTGILIVNSVSRTMFHYGFQSAEEVAQIFILLMTFVGLSNAARKGSHVVMTAILDLVSMKKKKILSTFVSGVTFLFLIFLLYLTWNYVGTVYANGRITSSLSIPLWTIYIILPTGCLMASFQYLLTFIMNLRDKDIVYVGPEKVYQNEITGN